MMFSHILNFGGSDWLTEGSIFFNSHVLSHKVYYVPLPQVLLNNSMGQSFRGGLTRLAERSGVNREDINFRASRHENKNRRCPKGWIGIDLLSLLWRYFWSFACIWKEEHPSHYSISLYTWVSNHKKTLNRAHLFQPVHKECIWIFEWRIWWKLLLPPLYLFFFSFLY